MQRFARLPAQLKISARRAEWPSGPQGRRPYQLDPKTNAIVGLLAPIFVALLISGCTPEMNLSSRHLAPIPSATLAFMAESGMSKGSPVLIRSFKKEAELEVWKMTDRGAYALLKTYPICRWSGQLGPKLREGDRQAPEGFYSITPASLNPNSSLYLSFNMGFPNAFDRAHDRTGSHLMVHGACSSAGCYSMTDEQISEIYAILRESFAGGQREVQMQALPFRMTPQNLTQHRYDSNMPFWRNLKEGSDRFEISRREPRVSVCGRRYVFDANPADAGVEMEAREPCPELIGDDQLSIAVAEKQTADDLKTADLAANGVRAIRIVYADGGQHASFKLVDAPLAYTGDEPSRFRPAPRTGPENVSRPEALAQAPLEVEIGEDGQPLPPSASPPTTDKGNSGLAALQDESDNPELPNGAQSPDAEQPERSPIFERLLRLRLF